MKRILAFLAALALASPAWADSQGSATGGTAGTQSTAAGCIDQSPSLSAGKQAALSCDASGNLKITGSSGGTPVPVKPAPVTPLAGTTATIATGGTAVTILSGPINGCYVVNPLNAAAQGIGAAENAYVDPVGTPGSSDSAANGTTTLLQSGQSFTCPPFASGINLKANAATSGHKLTVVSW